MQEIYSMYGISRQAHSQAIKREQDLELRHLLYIGFMHQVREIHPGMGLRKMYEQFVPEGIGRDAFIALGLREGLRLKTITNPMKTTVVLKNSYYSNLLVDKRFTGVNQIWVSDLFYFSIKGKHHYVVLIMDVYSRRIIGYTASANMKAENNVRALQSAFTLRGVNNYQEKLIHHSDRGSQYIYSGYTELLGFYGAQISMCNDVLENAHMERVNGTIKNDYLARRSIASLDQLKYWLTKDVQAYNHRAHDSLKLNTKKMTPLEFENNIKQLPERKRPVLEIFTIHQQIDEDPNQLSLFLGI